MDEYNIVLLGGLAGLFIGVDIILGYAVLVELIKHIRGEQTDLFVLALLLAVMVFFTPMITSYALFGTFSGIVFWESGVLFILFGIGCIVGPIYLYKNHATWYRRNLVSLLIITGLLLIVLVGFWFVNKERLIIIEAHGLEPLKSQLPQLLSSLFHQPTSTVTPTPSSL